MSFLLSPIIAGLLNIHSCIKTETFSKTKEFYMGETQQSLILTILWFFIHHEYYFTKFYPLLPKGLNVYLGHILAEGVFGYIPKVQNSELKHFSFSSAHGTNPRF